jgi:hypothetical protein
MKLVELKVLKNDTVYKRILDELRLKGLKNVYIATSENVDILDIILALVEFLDKNKNIVKKLNSDMFENIVVICIDEILESIGLDIISEEQIEKIIKLLKNSILIQKVSKSVMKKFKEWFSCCQSSIEYV